VVNVVNTPEPGPSVLDQAASGVWHTIRLVIGLIVLTAIVGGAIYVALNFETVKQDLNDLIDRLYWQHKANQAR
jgi:hypothetical protein